MSGQVHVRPERAASRACGTPAGCARAAPAPTPRRTTSRSASTRARSRTSRALRSFASATSSPSRRRRSTSAIQAAAQLKVVWKSDPKFGSGSSGNFWSWVRKAGDTNTHEPRPLHRDTGNVDAALEGAAKTVSATYKYHYNSFVPIGPHCAIADVGDGRRDRVRPGPVGQRASPQTVAHAARHRRPQNIRVICRTRARAPTAAACRRRRPSRPRRHLARRSASRCACSGCAGTSTAGISYGPSHMYDVKAGIDANGKIVGADWTSLRPGQHDHRHDEGADRHAPRGRRRRRPAARPRPTRRSTTRATHAAVLAKTQPLYEGSLKSSALRAPNAPQSYFASEQIVDELAYAAKMDPIAFRRQNIDGTTIARRALAVGARRRRRWRPAGSRRSPRRTSQSGRRRDRPRLRLRHVRVEPGRAWSPTSR